MADTKTLMDHTRELNDAFSDIAYDYVIPILTIVLGVALLILQGLFPLCRVSDND